MKRLAFAIVGVVASIAVAIVMMRPTWAVQILALVNCSTSAACDGGNNSSSGPGVQGNSALGTGVVGQTKFASTSSSNGKAGISGQDLSSSGKFDIGTQGTSTRGIGVNGVSSSNTGVVGTSSSGVGVSGKTSTGSEGVLGTASTTTGVQGISSSGSGSGAGVQGLAQGSGTGVLGTSVNGVGTSGLGSNSVGVVGNGNIGVEAYDLGGSATPANRTIFFADGFGGQLIRANNSHGQDVLTVSDFGVLNSFAITAGSSAVGTGVNGNGSFAGVQGSDAAASGGVGIQGNNTADSGSIAVRANSFGGNEFVGNGSNGRDNFIVDNSGNVFAHSFSATLTATQATSSGPPLPTYTSEVKQPTLEDFGETTLASGTAYVPLDPHFASALSHNQPYMVFLTPLGPTQGWLYATQRTLNGFYVREANGGHSTVAFDYRIVGKPYAVNSPPLLSPPSLRYVSKTRPTIPTFTARPKTKPL